MVVTPLKEIGESYFQKRYSVQSHVRVMDFIRILQETYQIASKVAGLALFAEHNQQRILLRSDEPILEVYKRLVAEDGWLYLSVDIQKPFG